MKKIFYCLLIFFTVFVTLLHNSATGVLADTVSDWYTGTSLINTGTSSNYRINSNQLTKETFDPDGAWYKFDEASGVTAADTLGGTSLSGVSNFGGGYWPMNESSGSYVVDSSGNGNTAYAPSPNVGYWPMDEGSGLYNYDSSGNGQTMWGLGPDLGWWALNETSGTAPGDSAGISAAGTATNTTIVDGVFGKARTFSTVTSVVSIPDNANNRLTASGITVEAWIYPTDISTYRQIVFKEQNWMIRIDNPAEGNKVSFFVFEDGNWNARVSSAAPPSTTGWTHVAGTWDGSNIRMYVNGVLSGGPVAVSGAVSNAVQPILIGNGWSTFFVGTIDDVRIYKRALSATEITNDMNSNVPSWVAGKYGTARHYDGISQATVCSDTAALDVTNTMTMEAWIYRDSDSGTWERLLSKSYIAAGSAISYWMQISNTDYLHCGVQKADATAPYRISAATIPTGAWTHVACTNDATGGVHAYINGSLSDGTTGGGVGAANVTTYPLYLGRLGSNSLWYHGFHGSIDEVRIYNYVRSATDIVNDSLATIPDVVTGQYSYARNFGGTASDYLNIGNPSHMQITGSQTIEMWVYPTERSQRRNPWCKSYGGEGCITQETAGHFNYYYGTAGANTTPYQTVSSVTAAPLNQWSHIAVVRDLINMKIYWYINGNLTNTADASYAAAVVSSLGATIGTGYTGFPYIGYIDDLRIYNYARSPDGIVADKNNTGRPAIVAGKYGSARDVSGYGEVFVRTPVYDLGTTWTIETWFKSPLAPVSDWNTLTRGNVGDHQFIVQKSTGHLGGYDNVGGTGWKDTGYVISNLSAGWHHIAAAANGSTTTYYIDGVQAGNALAWSSSSDIYAIGDYQGGTQPWGTIDDFRIYTTARNTWQIAGDMTNAPYASSATIVSTNLLSSVAAEDVVDSINSFSATLGASGLNGNTAHLQFSQNGSDWYNSSGTLNGYDDFTATTTIDLSGFGWSGKNFYYRWTFNGSSALHGPWIQDITLTYTMSGPCSPPNGGDFTLTKNCFFTAKRGGVDNGNLTIPAGKTLTINAGQNIGWNEGKSITIADGGSIAINSSGGTDIYDSGRDNDGIATGATLVDGKYGKARSFSGSGQYIDIPDSSSLHVGGGPFTIEAWVNPTSLAGRYWIFSTRTGAAAGGWQLEVGTGNGGTGRVSVTGVGTWIFDSNDNVISPDTWTHIAYTRSSNSDTGTMYINGSSISPLTTTAYTITNNTDAKRIGAALPGIIDDVRLYNYVRSPAQIAQDMNNETITGNGPVGWWTMDDQAKMQQAFIWVKDADFDGVKDSDKEILRATQPAGYVRRKDLLSHIAGDGIDGTCTPTSALNLNTTKCGSTRAGSAADAVFFSSTVLTSVDDESITVSATPTGLAVGDEILIINLQGTGSDYGNVGKYEAKKITAINGNTLSVDSGFVNTYDGTTQKIMVQRIPQYTAVTVNNTYSLTASAFDGSKGGVVFFRASGTVTVNSGGSITASSKGFGGGVKDTSGAEYYKGNWVSGGATGATGGSRGPRTGVSPDYWYQGGTGGAGAAGTADAARAAGTAGAGGYADGDGGAGAGYTGAGGGAGAGDGGTAAGGGGGGGGKSHQYAQADGRLTGTGATILSLGAGAPNGGGAGLSDNNLGSTSGYAIGGENGNPGGGIIFINANSIVTAAANQIVSNGGTGGAGEVARTRTSRTGSGGGGSGGQGATGGTIMLKVTGTLNLTASSITGKGGTGGAGGDGGDGMYQTTPVAGGAGGAGAAYSSGNDKGTAGGAAPCCFGGGGGGGGNSGWGGVIKIWYKTNSGSLTTIPTAETTVLP